MWGGKAVALAPNVELLRGQKGRGVGREFLPAYKWSGGEENGTERILFLSLALPSHRAKVGGTP